VEALDSIDVDSGDLEKRSSSRRQPALLREPSSLRPSLVVSPSVSSSVSPTNLRKAREYGGRSP
jgi:hypothetical protein